MYWVLEKKLIEYTVSTLRRVFAYTPSWLNQGLEIVQFGSGSREGNLLFEQYNEVAETYPRITVAGAGGVYNPVAFNDLIAVYDNDYYQMGSKTLQQVYLGGDNVVSFAIPPGMIGQSIRGVLTTLRWTGIDFGNSDISIYLYQNYNTNPVIVSSGSISSNYVYDNFKEMYSALSVLTTITDNTFALVYQVPSGSSYYIGVDPLYNGNYNNGMQQSGSIVGKLLLPGFTRIGGFFDGSIQFKCEAKNDTNTPRNLAEIISQYFVYLKHAQIVRNGTPDTMELTDDLQGTVSEWLSKGIMIKTLSEGPLSVRPRGTNDKIFGVTVTVNYFTEWYEDFPLMPLEAIEVNVNTYLQNVINNLSHD
jgi:hypothetical protein